MINNVNHVCTYNGRFPDFFADFACNFWVIGNENIIKDGTRFNLPQIETNGADLISFVQLGIRRVLRVIDLWMDPWSLIIWIVNLFWFPFALKEPYSSSKSKCEKQTK